MSVVQHLLWLVSWITVEPVEFLYCLMFTTSNIVRDNLFILKVCILDFDYSEEVCLNYTENGEADDEVKENVQDRVAELELWDGVLVALPSAFFCVFVGNWSDYHGRKLLLVLPFVGSILSYLAYMLNYYFFYEMSTGWLLLGSVVGLTGAYQCLNMGLYGYVSDVTSARDRTMRLSVLNGVFSLAYVVGNVMGSRLYDASGNYYLIFGISCGIAVLAIAYSLLFLRETVDATEEQKRQHGLFDLENVRACFRTALRRRPGNGRLHVLLLVANFAIFMFPLNTSHYDYLLTQLRYDWTIVEYSDYLSVQRICRLLGLFLLLPFLSRVARIDDALTASACTLATVAAYLLIALGQEDWTGPDGSWPAGWIMFLSAALQFNSVITVIIRSQCTKSVDEDETGRVFAVVALGQCLVPLVAYPTFGLIYQATLSTFPGAYLLVVSGLLVIAFFTSVYLYAESRRGNLGVGISLPTSDGGGGAEGSSKSGAEDSSSTASSTCSAKA